MSGEEWFSTDYDKGVSNLLKNSRVEAFVDADEYYADLRKEVEATEKDGQICWIGFDASGQTPMSSAPNNETEKKFPPRNDLPSDVKWFDLLQAASDMRNVPIRVLLNLHPSPKPPDKYKDANFKLVNELNSLQNCAAVNDFRYLFLNGTHHQKLVLVYNSKGLMAYCGTCDVELSRIKDKWCELQLKITGDAAGELYTIFHNRWREHTQLLQEFGSQKASIKPLSQLNMSASKSGNFLVQTATTYGNPSRDNPFWWLARLLDTFSKQVVNKPHRLIWGIGPISHSLGNDFFTEKEPSALKLIQQAKRQSDSYTFASAGHIGIYNQIKKAIANTKEYIYIEDQYLVCDKPMGMHKSMLDLLIDKVKESNFKKLIIFCTRIDDINEEFQGTGWAHRNNFIQSLASAGNDKVVVCQYKSKGSVGAPGDTWRGLFYIHSKTWVFDDQFLITGSANCNRRGYSHDSELGVGVYDQDKRFIKDLRINLWKRRLNTEGIIRSPLQNKELTDFISAAKYWENPSLYGLAIENNRMNSLEPRKHPDLNLQSYKAKVTAQPGIDPAISSLIDRLKMDGIWNMVVDPEGT